jgi:hypothetical protein
MMLHRPIELTVHFAKVEPTLSSPLRRVVRRNSDRAIRAYQFADINHAIPMPHDVRAFGN